jgi:hypothetical protein
MLSPQEVKQKAEKWWSNGSFLKAYIQNKPFSIIEIPQIGLVKPNEVSVNFSRINQEQILLKAHSKESKGYGYKLGWKYINTRGIGQSGFINKIYFESAEDFLSYIEKQQDFEVFKQNFKMLIDRIPQLFHWVEKNPLKLIEYNDKWDNLLKVCEYFVQSPKPNLYVRSLPIDIPTKFIESNTSILRTLLDHLLEKELDFNEKDFFKRFHLQTDEPNIRIRFLDESLYPHPALSQIGVWVAELANFKIDTEQIFVIENLTSFLTFPKVKKSIAIWGGGFGVNLLRDVKWMNNKQLYYWGDIDIHGFQILSQFRTRFPNTQSIMMDTHTFHQFHTGQRGDNFRIADVSKLSIIEMTLYHEIEANNWRLEQERISEKYLISSLPT